MKLRFTENSIIVTDDLNNSIVIDVETIKRAFNLQGMESKEVGEHTHNFMEQLTSKHTRPMGDGPYDVGQYLIDGQSGLSITKSKVKYMYGVKPDAYLYATTKAPLYATMEDLKDLIDEYSIKNEVDAVLSTEPLINEEQMTCRLINSLSAIDWEVGGDLFDKVSINDYKALLARLLTITSNNETQHSVVNDQFVVDFISKYKDSDNSDKIAERRYEPVVREETKGSIEVKSKELPNLQDYIKSIYWRTFRQHYQVPEAVPVNVLGKILKTYEKYKLHDDAKYKKDRSKAIGAFRRSREWQAYSKSIKKTIASKK